MIELCPINQNLRISGLEFREGALKDWLRVALKDWLRVALKDWLRVALKDWLRVALKDWLRVAASTPPQANTKGTVRDH